VQAAVCRASGASTDRRAGLARDAQRLLDGVAAAHDEVAAQRTQPATEVGERFLQKGVASRRLRKRRVEHEEREHFGGSLDSGAQRSLVVYAQVAREQNDRPGHRPRGGIRTWLMAWMTPFVAMTSGTTTFALFT